MSTLKRRTSGGAWETIGLPNNVGMTPQTLGYAESTTVQNTVSTEVDLTGLNVTITVPSGRRVRISGRINTGAASDNEVGVFALIKEGATEVGRITLQHAMTGAEASLIGSTIISPSAGMHTYKLTLQTTGGTVNSVPTTASPNFILVEDITGSTLPYQPASVPVGLLAQVQGFGAAFDFTTTVDIPGASLNVSVPAGRTLRLTAKIHVSTLTESGNRIRLMFVEGSTILGAGYRVLSGGSSGEELIAQAIVSPSAGAHTYKLQVLRDTGGGTARIYSSASPNEPTLFTIEDITPTPAAANTSPSATLGYAETTSLNQTVTAGADVTGLATTITVPAGRRIKITGKVHINNTLPANDRHVVRIMEGVTQLNATYGNTSNNGLGEDFIVQAILTPSAGTHTYKISAGRQEGDGVVTAYADSTLPAYIVVEDITGVSSEYMATAGPVGRLAYTTLTDTAALGDLAVVPGLSLNVSVPSSRTLKITFHGQLHTSAASGWIIQLLEDGVLVGRLGTVYTDAPEYHMVDGSAILTPSAGAHTYTVQLDQFTGSGTADLNGASPGYPIWLLAEDITPALNPSTGSPGSTLGYAEATVDQGTLTTEVDLIGLTSTITVPAGRRLRISLKTEVRGTANDVYVYNIKEGATVLQRMTGRLPSASSETVNAAVIVTPTAGTHTYKASASLATGTGIINGASTTYPAYLLIEDITGSVWPAGSSVTPGMIASEPWVDWVPTTNLTGGTLNFAKYVRTGRKISYRFKYTLAGAGVGAFVSITLPAQVHADYAIGANGVLGQAALTLASGTYLGDAAYNTATSIFLRVGVATGSYVNVANVTSTVPAVWASGDSIFVSGTYEAAS